MARVINYEERKLEKTSQDLIDSAFAYLRAYKRGTDFQKTTSRKKFIRCLEASHEFMSGSGKILKIKPPAKVTSYRTDAKMVTVIQKP